MATQTIRCSSCGAPLENLYGCCPYCGSVIAARREQTTSFSSRNSGAVNFDPFRQPPPGTPPVYPPASPPIYPAQPVEPVNKKSRLTAILLCLFLGWLGVHKAYLGKPGFCFLYIFLFCIPPFFITFILVIIDLVHVCTMSDADFDRKYNQKKN